MISSKATTTALLKIGIVSLTSTVKLIAKYPAELNYLNQQQVRWCSVNFRVNCLVEYRYESIEQSLELYDEGLQRNNNESTCSK
jgi:hypothetical protein